MRSVYERTNLIITEFNTEDVITTSGAAPEPITPFEAKKLERENRYGSFDAFDLKPPTGGWF